MRIVTQRPKSFIGETIVEAGLLIRRQPNPRMSYEGWSGGTRTWSRLSTTSLSADPLPCAVHTPEQARITGSRADTSPLAGTCTSTFVPPVVNVGCRFDTMRISSPEGVHAESSSNWRAPGDLAFVPHAAIGFQFPHQRVKILRNRCNSAEWAWLASAGSPVFVNMSLTPATHPAN